jgi:hypothetical protein
MVRAASTACAQAAPNVSAAARRIRSRARCRDGVERMVAGRRRCRGRRWRGRRRCRRPPSSGQGGSLGRGRRGRRRPTWTPRTSTARPRSPRHRSWCSGSPAPDREGGSADAERSVVGRRQARCRGLPMEARWRGSMGVPLELTTASAPTWTSSRRVRDPTPTPQESGIITVVLAVPTPPWRPPARAAGAGADRPPATSGRRGPSDRPPPERRRRGDDRSARCGRGRRSPPPVPPGRPPPAPFRSPTGKPSDRSSSQPTTPVGGSQPERAPTGEAHGVDLLRRGCREECIGLAGAGPTAAHRDAGGCAAGHVDHGGAGLPAAPGAGDGRLDAGDVGDRTGRAAVLSATRWP